MMFTESKHVFERHSQVLATIEIDRPSTDTWDDLRGFSSETSGQDASPNRADVVLIAHSDEVRRGGLAWELGANGCSVVEVEDGSELLDYLDDQGPWLPVPHPDLIVAELEMPGCSGLEAAKRLRRSGDLTPIIFINVSRSPAAAAIASRLPKCVLVHGDIEGGVLRAAVEEALHASQ